MSTLQKLSWSSYGTYLIILLATAVLPCLGENIHYGIQGDIVYQPIAQYTYPLDLGDERFYETPWRGDYGSFGEGNAHATWSVTQTEGALHLEAADVPGHNCPYAAMWHSLAQNSKDLNRVLDPLEPFPWPITSAYQPRIVGMYVRAKGAGVLRLELNNVDPDNNQYQIANYAMGNLSPTHYRIHNWFFDPGEVREPFRQLVLKVDGIDYVYRRSSVYVDEVGFLVEPIVDISTLESAFLGAAAQVFRCYDPESGYVGEFACFPARDMVSIPGLGLAAITAACGVDLGMVSLADARELTKVTVNRLLSVPHHCGFFPRFIRDHEGSLTPVYTYSTVDSAIALLPAYVATCILNLKSEKQAILRQIRRMDFTAVASTDGYIGHGFDLDGARLPSVWSHADGESALVNILAKLDSSTSSYSFDRHADISHVYEGRGFLAEMGALFFSQFGGENVGSDSYGLNWYTRRLDLLNAQRSLLNAPFFIGGHSPCEVASQLGHHGYLESGTAAQHLITFSDSATLDTSFGDLQNWIAPHYRFMTAALQSDSVGQDIETMFNLGVMHLLSGPAESVLLNPEDWSIKRYHSKQAVQNASFCALGTYHAIAKTSGRNAIYNATKSDSVLNRAVQSVWNSKPKTPVTMQAEKADPINHKYIRVKQRSRANGQRTALLYAGEGLAFDIKLGSNDKINTRIRYSNDNYGPLERINLSLLRMDTNDTHQLGEIIVADTGNNGNGWNVMNESSMISSSILVPGHYKLILTVSRGDGWGVEVDSVTVTW